MAEQLGSLYTKRPRPEVRQSSVSPPLSFVLPQNIDKFDFKCHRSPSCFAMTESLVGTRQRGRRAKDLTDDCLS